MEIGRRHRKKGEEERRTSPSFQILSQGHLFENGRLDRCIFSCCLQESNQNDSKETKKKGKSHHPTGLKRVVEKSRADRSKRNLEIEKDT